MAKQGFTPQMREWMKLVVRNASRQEIMQQIFHVPPDQMTHDVLHKYDCKITRWRQHPDYHEEWLKAFKAQWSGIMAEAIGVVEEGLHDDSLPWRRTQHANLALAYGTKILVGEEERAVHVKVEGMPDLGSPDD